MSGQNVCLAKDLRLTVHFYMNLVGTLAGELDYLSVLTSQRTFSETSLAYLEGLQNARRASIEIYGLLLRGSLTADGYSLQMAADVGSTSQLLR